MMSDADSVIARLILDQELMSNSQSHVMNVQLRSVYSKLGLTSNIGTVPRLPSSNPYLLNGLSSLSMYQDPVLAQLDLLNASMQPPTQFPDVPLATTGSDMLRALGVNYNRHGISISSRDLFFQHRQSSLSDFLPTDIGALDWSNSNILEQLKPFNNVAALNAHSDAETSIDIINAIMGVSTASPSQRFQNNNIEEQVRKRAMEIISAEVGVRNKKSKYLDDIRSTSQTSNIRLHENFRPSKAYKKDHRDKESAAATTPSATYEDAKLLIDSFVTIASSTKKKTNEGSVISVSSRDSIEHYRDVISSSELTCDDVWDTVPSNLFISMAQMSLINMNDVEACSVRNDRTAIGCVAMCCKHCKCVIGFGENFFKSLQQGHHSHRVIQHVQSECISCPKKIKEIVRKLSSSGNSSVLGLKISNDSSLRFFEHVWSKAQNLGCEDKKEEENSSDESETDDTDCESDDSSSQADSDTE